MRAPVGPGSALVGDAGLHQDPWSSQGMDMASVHATFLAEALIAWLGGSECEAAAMAANHRRRDEHGLEQYHKTVQLAQDLRQLEPLWAARRSSSCWQPSTGTAGR